MQQTRLAILIRQELQKRGVTNLKEAARILDVSPELVRMVLNRGIAPKDSTLVKIARALGLEPAVLIMAAHRQKLPEGLLGDILSVAPPAGGDWNQKRKWPLSQEQCAYLERELRPDEI